MTALTPAEKDRQKKARARVYRIREGMRNYLATLADVHAAWVEGDWKTLGHASWEEYLTREFGSDQVKLPPEQRQKALKELRLEDMPNRALAAAMNVDEKTVRRDRAAANAAVIEGEVVDPPAETPIVGALKQAITDAEDRASEHTPDHRVRPPVRTDTPPSEAGADELSEGSAPAPDHPPLSGDAGEIPGSEGFPGDAGGTPAPVAGEVGSAPASPAPQEQERTEEVCPTCLRPLRSSGE